MHARFPPLPLADQVPPCGRECRGEGISCQYSPFALRYHAPTTRLICHQLPRQFPSIKRGGSSRQSRDETGCVSLSCPRKLPPLPLGEGRSEGISCQYSPFALRYHAPTTRLIYHQLPRQLQFPSKKRGGSSRLCRDETGCVLSPSQRKLSKEICSHPLEIILCPK